MGRSNPGPESHGSLLKDRQAAKGHCKDGRVAETSVPIHRKAEEDAPISSPAFCYAGRMQALGG